MQETTIVEEHQQIQDKKLSKKDKLIKQKISLQQEMVIDDTKQVKQQQIQKTKTLLKKEVEQVQEQQQQQQQFIQVQEQFIQEQEQVQVQEQEQEIYTKHSKQEQLKLIENENVMPLDIEQPNKTSTLPVIIPLEGTEITNISKITLLSTEQPTNIKANIDIVPQKSVTLQQETTLIENEYEKSFNLKRLEQSAIETTTTQTMPNKSIEIFEIDLKENYELIDSELNKPIATAKQIQNILESVSVDKPLIQESIKPLEIVKAKEEIAKLQLSALDAQEISEVNPIQSEKEFDQKANIDMSSATASFEQHKSIEVTEITETETVEKKDMKIPINLQHIKSKISFNEPIEISEIITEDKPSKYYPELIVPTESALETLIEHKTYQTEEIDLNEKESVMIAQKLPTQIAAKIKVDENISLEITESDVIESENVLPEQKKQSFYSAIDSVTFDESYLTTLVDTQSPIEEKTFPEIEMKEANVGFIEQSYLMSDIIQTSEQPTELVQLEATPTVRANQELIGLVINETNESIVHELHSSFESLPQIGEKNAETAFTPIMANTTLQLQALESLQNIENIPLTKSVTSNVEFESSEAKDIFIVNIHESEDKYEPKKIADKLHAVATVDEQESLIVKQVEVDEKESPISQFEKGDEYKIQPITTYSDSKVPITSETNVSLQAADLKQSDDLSVEAQSSYEENKTQLIFEQTVLEDSSNLILPQQLPSKTAKQSINLNESIEISENIIQEKENKSKLNVLEMQQYVTMISPDELKSIIVEETQPNSSVNLLEELSPQTCKINASVTKLEIGANISQQLLLDQIETLILDTQPDQQTAIGLIDMQEAVQISNELNLEKESEVLPTELDIKEAKSLFSNGLHIPTTDLPQISESVTNIKQLILEECKATKQIDSIRSIQHSDITAYEETENIIKYQIPKEVIPNVIQDTNKNHLEVSICDTSEKEQILPDTIKIPSAIAESRLTDAMKLILVEETQIDDNVGLFKNITSLGLQPDTAMTTNLNRVIVENVDIFEKEFDLKIADQKELRIADAMIDSVNAIIVTSKQQFETEGNIEEIKHTQYVASIKDTTNLPVATTEDVFQNLSVADIEPEKLTEAISNVKYDISNESTILDNTVLEMSQEHITTKAIEEKPNIKFSDGNLTVVSSIEILAEKEIEIGETEKLKETNAQITQTDMNVVPIVEVAHVNISSGNIDNFIAVKGTASSNLTDLLKTNEILEPILFENVEFEKNVTPVGLKTAQISQSDMNVLPLVEETQYNISTGQLKEFTSTAGTALKDFTELLKNNITTQATLYENVEYEKDICKAQEKNIKMVQSELLLAPLVDEPVTEINIGQLDNIKHNEDRATRVLSEFLKKNTIEKPDLYESFENQQNFSIPAEQSAGIKHEITTTYSVQEDYANIKEGNISEFEKQEFNVKEISADNYQHIIVDSPIISESVDKFKPIDSMENKAKVYTEGAQIETLITEITPYEDSNLIDHDKSPETKTAVLSIVPLQSTETSCNIQYEKETDVNETLMTSDHYAKVQHDEHTSIKTEETFEINEIAETYSLSKRKPSVAQVLEEQLEASKIEERLVFEGLTDFNVKQTNAVSIQPKYAETKQSGISSNNEILQGIQDFKPSEINIKLADTNLESITMKTALTSSTFVSPKFNEIPTLIEEKQLATIVTLEQNEISITEALVLDNVKLNQKEESANKKETANVITSTNLIAPVEIENIPQENTQPLDNLELKTAKTADLVITKSMTISSKHEEITSENLNILPEFKDMQKQIAETNILSNMKLPTQTIEFVNEKLDNLKTENLDKLRSQVETKYIENIMANESKTEIHTDKTEIQKTYPEIISTHTSSPLDIQARFETFKEINNKQIQNNKARSNIQIDEYENKQSILITPMSAEQEDTKKQVFVTTFKSVQDDNGETIIASENKRLTSSDGMIVEEILSDGEQDTFVDKQKPSLEIVEVDELTGEALPVIPEDYKISVIEEEAPIVEIEETPTKEITDVEVLEVVPDEEESIPIDVIEDEEEEEDKPLDEATTTIKQKKKKKIVKKKTAEQDDIIKALLEQEIEKTVLEKYEKIDFEKPKKEKPIPQDLTPIAIVRKEQKPTKLMFTEAVEEPQAIKLKPSKRKEKPVEDQSVQLPKFKLKSRMVIVEFPPEALKPVINEINAERQVGELSRTIEEAQTLLKFKPKKFKGIKKIKDDLERPDLEKYEKYVSSSEDEEKVKPYERPVKEKAPEEPEEAITLSLGKGKKKPEEDEEPESVKLKKVPTKLKEEEEAQKTVIQKKKEVVVKDIEHKKPIEITLEPFKPVDFDQTDYPKEDLEKYELPDEEPKEKETKKPKHKRKEKSKPEQEFEELQIIPGVPKPEAKQPEEEVKFRIPHKDKVEEPTDEIKLKPIDKPKPDEKVKEQKPIIQEVEPTKEKSTSPEIVTEKDEKPVKPKTKKKPKDTKVEEEIPDKQFKIEVRQEEALEEIPEEKPADAIVKKRKPKTDKEDSVKVTVQEREPILPEESVEDFTVTQKETELEDEYPELQVRVIDIEEKDVEIEEIIEEKIVTRRKKPKPQEETPEESTIKVKDLSPEDIVVAEDIKIKEQKPEEQQPEDVSFKIVEKKEIPEESVDEVSIKKKKPKKVKEVELIEDLKVTIAESKPMEEVVEEIKLKKKKPKEDEPVEAKLEISVKETEPEETEEIHEVKISQKKPKKIIQEEEPEEFQIKLSEPIEDVIPDENFIIKKKVELPESTEDVEVEIKLTPIVSSVEVAEDTIIKKKKPKKPSKEVADLTVKISEQEAEIVTEEIVIIDEEPTFEPVVEEETTKPFVIKVKNEEIVPEEIEAAEIKLKPKKTIKPSIDEEEVQADIKLTEKPIQEQPEEKLTIKKKKPKKEAVDEEAAELKVQVKEVIPTEEIVEEIIDEDFEKPKSVEEIVEETVQFISKVKDVEEKPTDEVAEVILKPKKPKKAEIKEEEDVAVGIKLREKPADEQPEEKLTIKKKKPTKPKQVEEAVELKVQVVEEVPDLPEEEIVTIEEELEETKPKEEVPEEKLEKYAIKIKEIEETKSEEIDEVVFKPKKPKAVVGDEVEVQVKLPEKPVEEQPEGKLTIKAKKPKKQPDEGVAVLDIKQEVIEERPVEVIEEEVVDETVIRRKKPKEKEIDKFEEEIPAEFIIKQKQQEEPEDQVADVTIKPKKPKKVEQEDVEVEVSLRRQSKTEEPSEQLTIKKKKPKKKVEDAEAVLEMKQESIVEQPVEIEEEEIIEEALVRRKPKQKPEPTVEDLDEESYSVSIHQIKPKRIVKDVEGEATITKKRPVKTMESPDEESAELSIKKMEEYEETEDIEEFIVSKKPKERPTQVIEEHEQEYTVKKLKRPRKGRTDIPEYTDTENVTFRARSTKTMEDVDQEFKIALDSYAEEEISMSGKVKLRKQKQKTYSEETSEAQIKIIQEYDDGEGPIIEEIIDDSSEDNTMYDVDEPEEFEQEELPPDQIELKLKSKKSKPRYSIQEEDEEEILVGLKQKKQQDVYDEDSLTVKKKKKRSQQVYNEEGASLNITKEMEFTESDEENLMYSICNYIADNDEAINLVEGEKVYVIERHNSEWWFVKKNLTEEQGWVPSQYLMEPVSYTHYVQKKLNEKIDKLPVFERPAPDEKAIAPRFIEKLQPIHTPDGYTIQFECKVEGLPRPQIAWFRQTAIIKPSQDFQMYYDDDNVATLIIREVFPEDAGMFTCVAKNSAGFASSTTELIVESPLSDHGSDATGLSRKSMSRESSLADILEGIPPTFSRKPKAQYVDEGSNVILECRLVAVPEPDIIWTFNGKEITTEKNIKVVTESDMHMYCSVVHIGKVLKSQEGQFEVIAKNREGESRLPIMLKVKTGEKEAPQILEPLKNMIIREGESAVLSTQIIGNPPPKVTWYKDGKPIKGANTKSDKDTHTLTLIAPKLHEKGEYTVKAVNPLGAIETLAYLTIEEATSGHGEPPFFAERFEEQTVPVKGSIKLNARITGNPVPEIEWLFNNTPLYPSDKVKQVYDGENIELTILNANPETDSGDYKCIASNPLGKTSHGAQIIVEVDEVTFTKKLKKNISIEESQSLTLECETSHVVSTKWFFNNKELSGMDHRVVVHEGKIHKLVIRNTTLRDAGKYKCKVKDKETDSTVEVMQRKPEFTKPLQDYEVKEQEIAFLDVEITSDTAEVTWIKDGEKLTIENKKLEFVKEGKVRKLIIRNASVHDEGEYTCVLDDQECTAELIVIELPPKLIKEMVDVTVAKGEKASFEIELTKGDALVKWFKDNEELEFSEHIQLSIDGKRQKLKIYSSTMEDDGEYSCQVGDQISSAKLIVEEPMVDFTLRLPDVTLAPKNNDAEFIVNLSQPDAELTWFKKGKKITPDTKHDIFVEGTIRRLIIHNANNDDEGEISCAVANAKDKTKLKVEEIQTPPVILSDKDKTYKVKENDDVTFNIKFSGTPKPEATWSTKKTIVKKSNRIIPTIDEQSACLTIKKVVDDDEGDYTIKLLNPVGDAEASLKLIIMRPPMAPGAPQPLNIGEDSLTLFWKSPEDDGNSEITEYILEYRNIKEEKWTQITKIKDTTHYVTKLTTESEYVFRSIAINDIGPSPPSPLSPTIKIAAEKKQEKPSVQEPLQDITTELDKEITLSCIFGGNPEPKTTWYRNGTKIDSKLIRYENRISKYFIERTTIDTEATYSCKAENNLGSAETSCKIIVQQKPIVTIEEKQISQKLRTSSTMTVKATINAYPKPQIKWYKEMNEIRTTKRCTIETTETSSTIIITNLSREDSGKYKIIASNAAGSTTVEVIIKVIDKPSRPTSLEIKDYKKDSITLEWTPPIDDGGLEVVKYTLEKCDLQNNIWMKVSEFEKDIQSFCVQKLSENAQYMFRILASNPIGTSEPTESETVTLTKKLDKPSPPRAPIDVTGMTENSFTLSWEPSEFDGGCKMVYYIVEMREISSKTYQLLGTTEANITNIFVSNVIKESAYQFRIYAKNDIGKSEPLETDDKIIVGRRITPPSAPQNLRTPDVSSRSVTLEWEVPTSNGGSEITGYVIEKRSSTSKKWTKVVTLDAHCLRYTVDNLKDKCEYSFQVSAENSVGISTPATTSPVILKTHATVPSPPTGPLEARAIAANTHIFEWGIPESDGGAPLLGYNIAIRDIKKTMWIEVGRVPPDIQRFQIRDLQEDHEYYIRIFARNEIGLSEPLESEELYKVMTTGYEMLPDEPRTEEPTGMSTENTSSWLRDHNMDADISSYARAKLLRKDEYFFRIWHNAKKLFK